MKYIKSILQVSGLLLLLVLFSSCGTKNEAAEEQAAMEPSITPEVIEKKPAKPTLPRRFQQPAYMIGEEIQLAPVEEGDDVTLKVGATIRSTTGPQPLWDITKRLAAMKGMNVSWESDVDQNVLVDVDISAKDDFYKAIDNLLRQVDYYHEMQGDTIVVKYRETKKYQVGMPYTKQLYETGTGGDVLGGANAETNVEGTIRLDSKGNEYDIWANIEENLNAILDVWTTEEVTEVSESDADGEGSGDSGTAMEDGDEEVTVAAGTRRRSGTQNLYIIDKNIGQITVTAPRPLLEKVDDYISSLKDHLYKQISIEAKIIEVITNSESTIGINWDQVLKNLSITGSFDLGGASGIIFSNDSSIATNDILTSVGINDTAWSAFISALDEQGETKVLSNPKISVLNGQPALISVGRNITYIESIETETDNDTDVTTFTVNTDRLLSGIGMALTATVIKDNEVIMNLVPVVSELEGNDVNNTAIGNEGGFVALPVINIREISTTVKVKSGEMLVIGGLISSDEDNTSNFAPGMRNVPLIKYLFGYEQKQKFNRELIILLKPVVI
ncbi:MAG: pilus (MSHA type) biogenesis protein MshL [Desulfocapsaceae bacterium]|nr:pilus (MSHA type) biogenesis protein MshL [Desulfocapsaceae bacterium]